MSFKIHLLIVSIMIIVMLGVIKLITRKSSPSQQLVTVEVSPYKIEIERANWGINCKDMLSEESRDNYLQSSSSTKLVENNVLERVANHCNTKPKCEIPINNEFLGDPFPGCGYKIFQVEYRCFTVDRIRVNKGSDGSIIIDCDKLLASQ